MSEDEDRLYLSLMRTELDQVSRALAVAAAADTSAALVALGMALDGRAVPAGELVPVLKGAMHALRSYQYGNAAPDLAAGMTDTCRALLERLARAGDPLAQEAAADPLAGRAPEMTSMAREDEEVDACWSWAKEARHRAVVDGREAIDGAALDAWQERARRAAREVVAAQDRAFEECAEAVLADVGGSRGEQLAAAFRARKGS